MGVCLHSTLKALGSDPWHHIKPRVVADILGLRRGGKQDPKFKVVFFSCVNLRLTWVT